MKIKEYKCSDKYVSRFTMQTTDDLENAHFVDDFQYQGGTSTYQSDSYVMDYFFPKKFIEMPFQEAYALRTNLRCLMIFHLFFSMVEPICYERVIMMFGEGFCGYLCYYIYMTMNVYIMYAY